MSTENLQTTEEITKMKNRISNLRKKQVQIQNLIAKQEENEIFDESLYGELDAIDEEISNLESEIFNSEEWAE